MTVLLFYDDKGEKDDVVLDTEWFVQKLKSTEEWSFQSVALL